MAPIPPAPPGIQARYLDKLFLDQPALALDQVRRELGHLGTLVKSMIDQSLDAVLSGSEAVASALSRADDDVDKIYEQIINYLGKLSQQDLINPQPQYLQNFVGIANYLENIGDVVEKDLLALVAKRNRQQLTVSESTSTELRALAAEVCRAFERALAALESGDPKDALEVQKSKRIVTALAEKTTAHIAKRLVADEPNRLQVFQLETEIIETYKRFNSLTRRIARLSVADHDSDAGAEQGPDQNA